MKVLVIFSLCILSLVSTAVFALSAKSNVSKKVQVSYYGLTNIFDDSPYSAYGSLFSVIPLNDKKMKVSIRGSKSTSLPQCANLAPQLDLAITNLGGGKSQIEILPTTKINGKQISETGFVLNSFEVMALEPANSSIHSLAISLGYVNPNDAEDTIDLHLNVNELTATMRSRDGDDDSGNVFEVVALKAKRTGQLGAVIHQIRGNCY